MRTFKKFGGEQIYDVGEYLRNYIKQNPNIVIMVGCDSLQLRKKTQYAISVCLRHPGNGVHVIFYRETVDKIKDFWTRLWGEVERSLEIAEYLETELNGHYKRFEMNELKNLGFETHQNKLIDIHLDINSVPGLNKKNKSNQLYQASTSYLKGMGYRVYAKPDSPAATYSADLLCR